MKPLENEQRMRLDLRVVYTWARVWISQLNTAPVHALAHEMTVCEIVGTRRAVRTMHNLSGGYEVRQELLAISIVIDINAVQLPYTIPIKVDSDVTAIGGH